MTRRVVIDPEYDDTPYPDIASACDFCARRPVRHEYCPGEIHTAPGKQDDRVWTCACSQTDHKNGALMNDDWDDDESDYDYGPEKQCDNAKPHRPHFWKSEDSETGQYSCEGVRPF